MEDIGVAVHVRGEEVVGESPDVPRHGAWHRVVVGCALFEEGERHADLVDCPVDGGEEVESARHHPEVFF